MTKTSAWVTALGASTLLLGVACGDDDGAPGPRDTGGAGGVTAGGDAGAGHAGTSDGGTTSPGGSGGEASQPLQVAGGSSGSPDGGASGGGGESAEPPTACGNGVLEPGERCCTPEWVERRVALSTLLVGALLPGTKGCMPRTEQAGVELCGSGACEGGATGCETEITEATVEYSPETREISGQAEVVIRGRSLGSWLGLTQSCMFTATLEDLEYRAPVLTLTTPEALRVRLGNPTLFYRLQIEGCGALADVAEVLLNGPLKPALELPLRRALMDAVDVSERCPY